MSSAKSRPFCLDLNVLSLCISPCRVWNHGKSLSNATNGQQQLQGAMSEHQRWLTKVETALSKQNDFIHRDGVLDNEDSRRKAQRHFKVMEWKLKHYKLHVFKKIEFVFLIYFAIFLWDYSLKFTSKKI